ncbi:MAG: protoheme IX farnesyltransferase [Geobacteraceae bacterium GWC2_58_44]|nr:MAG: protoheme IX farnesyltransferase [Geobacteraceae bacterium GWC2_58_44]HBG05821.1 protoheme IX farnesyltransferase [Geobacter sp.]
MISSATGNRLKESPGLFNLCCALFVLSKPGIVAAVTFSGFTGMVVAGRGLPEPGIGVPCLASLLLMSAGSAVTNSVLDRRMDAQMERLTLRSAALRQVGAGPALAAALGLTSAAVAIAAALLSTRTALLLIAAALSYTLYYTLFLKRHTHWAAVMGGLPGAFPALIGHAAVAARPDWTSLALFLIMLLWQPPHFWLLSLSHREEYRAAGVPILPLVKGERFTKSCIYLGIAALIPASVLLRFGGPCSTGYAGCALLLGICYLLACRFLMANGARYREAFRCSIAYILLLFTLIIVDICL